MLLVKVIAPLLLLMVVAQQSSAECDNLTLCIKWYKVMEEELATDELTLQSLEEIFYPVSGHEPVVFNVTYIITVNNEQPEHYYLGWSSSGLFSKGMLLQDDVELSSSFNTTLPNNRCEIDYALKKLTSRLKGFAKHQGLPSEWNDDIKAYAWDDAIEEKVTTYVTVIAILATVVLAQTILPTIFLFIQHLLGKRGPTRLLIWTAADSLSLLNLIVLASEARFLMYMYESNEYPEVLVVKFKLLVAVFVSSTVFGVVGFYLGPQLPTAPVFATSCCNSSFNCFMFLCCCMCACIENRSKATKQRLAYCSLFFNYALFMNLLSWTAIPSILFLFVYPLEALSAVSLLCCICLVYFSAVAACRSKSLFINEENLDLDEDRFMKYGMYPCMLCSLAIFFIIMLCLMILYIYIIASGVGINAFSLSVITIVPPMATARIVTWIKKAHANDEEQNDANDEEQNDANDEEQNDANDEEQNDANDEEQNDSSDEESE